MIKKINLKQIYKDRNGNEIETLADDSYNLIQDKINEIIDALNQTPTPTHKRKYFVPKVGEKYWVIDELSIFIEFTNTKEDYDEINIKSGNCFATEQDAQDELNRRQALVRIWNNYDDKYAWEIDWDNSDQVKYGIDYEHSRKKLSGNYFSEYQFNTELPYFKSAEDRNQFVEDNEKDLLTVFNIKK